MGLWCTCKSTAYDCMIFIYYLVLVNTHQISFAKILESYALDCIHFIADVCIFLECIWHLPPVELKAVSTVAALVIATPAPFGKAKRHVLTSVCSMA